MAATFPMRRHNLQVPKAPSSTTDASTCPQLCHAPLNHHGDTAMAKGMDSKKEQKKKPAKTAKEKKAEKNEKKTTKGFAPT